MKQLLNDLAIFGGPPAFEEKLHVGRPNIPNTESVLKRIRDVLENKWLTNNGPFVQDFERQIAERVGVKHCLAVCNGTLALEILVRAAGLSGEIILPSFTFIATAHALQWQGITPVFCDVELDTHNIDPGRVEQCITPRTTAIVGIHLWGRPCDIEKLQDIGNRHNLKVFFDAAHAFGCSYRGRMIGSYGDAEVFSFHATKIMNSFEGGAVLTNDDEMATRIELMRNFGFAGYDSVVSMGINGKMSEASAAMGLASLENLDEFLAISLRNYKQYQHELREIQGISLLSFDEREKCNFHYIVAEVDESMTKVSRDQLMAILWEENILARRYFYPGCHRMEPYRSHFPDPGHLPNTETLARKVLSLPTGTAIGPEQISKICQMIRFIVRYGSQIRERLEKSVIE